MIVTTLSTLGDTLTTTASRNPSRPIGAASNRVGHGRGTQALTTAVNSLAQAFGQGPTGLFDNQE